ncbi:Uncharacterized protein OBRU01_00792 [Operophtera brumata]|uniref:Uncharacterized protein n=1 Tax=Operophtera brumata TaxID=104452 RepID=A0A0L7LUW9_OPEBR|nr:Uncharacterized protein OBRU01_00792 [Operophtera brumata]
MVKNQELQIEALTTQVQSLKDINQITKDLLEIRNNEVKAMEVQSLKHINQITKDLLEIRNNEVKVMEELQIEALTTQVQSLKDINQITNDLLEIRNNEERYQAMDARYKAEKERHSLVLQRAQNSSNINEDLRKEN